jgi:hypothetical protein
MRVQMVICSEGGGSGKVDNLCMYICRCCLYCLLQF